MQSNNTHMRLPDAAYARLALYNSVLLAIQVERLVDEPQALGNLDASGHEVHLNKSHVAGRWRAPHRRRAMHQHICGAMD
jgi:hypothetical protein